jgi:hypothetical protein
MAVYFSFRLRMAGLYFRLPHKRLLLFIKSSRRVFSPSLIATHPTPPIIVVKLRKSLPSDLIEGRLCLTFSSQTIIAP